MEGVLIIKPTIENGIYKFTESEFNKLVKEIYDKGYRIGRKDAIIELFKQDKVTNTKDPLVTPLPYKEPITTPINIEPWWGKVTCDAQGLNFTSTNGDTSNIQAYNCGEQIPLDIPDIPTPRDEQID